MTDHSYIKPCQLSTVNVQNWYSLACKSTVLELNEKFEKQDLHVYRIRVRLSVAQLMRLRCSMNQFQKRPMAPLLALLIFVSACGPKAPDLSGMGKALGKINEAVACALSTAGSAEEVFYLAIDLDSFDRQFLATVKPLNIKSAKEFDNSAPVEAKELIAVPATALGIPS